MIVGISIYIKAKTVIITTTIIIKIPILPSGSSETSRKKKDISCNNYKRAVADCVRNWGKGAPEKLDSRWVSDRTRWQQKRGTVHGWLNQDKQACHSRCLRPAASKLLLLSPHHNFKHTHIYTHTQIYFKGRSSDKETHKESDLASVGLCSKWPGLSWLKSGVMNSIWSPM